MTHDRDACANYGVDGIQSFPPTFQLDCVHASLLEEAPGIADGLFRGNLIGHERQVADQQGRQGTASDRPAMVKHLFHCDRQCVLIAQNHHAK